MKRFALGFSAVCLAATLVACGGGGDGDQAPAIKYTTVVTFGDSLSDVGTYRVGLMKTMFKGGTYTINGEGNRNWTEFLSAQLGVTAPCSAQTGLNSSGALAALAVATVSNNGCFNYAQGGARVTDPVGPANAALLSLDPPEAQGALGQLTVPVVSQIQNHLTAVGGAFSGSELVTVMAGGNDIFRKLAEVALADDNPRNKTPEQVVADMATAGGELASYVKDLIVAKGAKRTVVVNLVDVSKSPFAYSQSIDSQSLINAMVVAFNTELSKGLNGASDVLLVDAYTASRDQAANPAQFGLTNATTPACNLSDPTNPLGSSLMCTKSNLVAGIDESKYLFADSVHPTPTGYRLLAQLVAQKMIARGWL